MFEIKLIDTLQFLLCAILSSEVISNILERTK